MFGHPESWGSPAKSVRTTNDNLLRMPRATTQRQRVGALSTSLSTAVMSISIKQDFVPVRSGRAVLLKTKKGSETHVLSLPRKPFFLGLQGICSMLAPNPVVILRKTLEELLQDTAWKYGCEYCLTNIARAWNFYHRCVKCALS